MQEATLLLEFASCEKAQAALRELLWLKFNNYLGRVEECKPNGVSQIIEVRFSDLRSGDAQFLQTGLDAIGASIKIG